MITFLILFYIAIVITTVLIIINTSTTSKALTYLLLVFIFPIVGIIIYFSVGINYRTYKLYNKKLHVDKNAFPELENHLKEFSTKTLSAYKTTLHHFFNLAQFSHTKHILTPNNQVDLLINGENKFPEVLKSLREAQHHIHIEYYIFENDTIGTQIGEILKQKASEGVEVRFIYDDFGSKSIRKSFVKSLRESGVEAYPFYKIKLLFFTNRINYRNHRKIIIIDGKVGYTGGINISDKYINPNTNHLFWRDTHIKITGDAVLYLQKVFLADWNFCSHQNIGVTQSYFPVESTPVPSKKQLVQIISSGPDSDHPNIMYAMIQSIMLAQKEILITTPYFIPESSFINALKIASLSDIDIKLLVPGISDSSFVNAASNSYYKELLDVGIEIYRYKKGFVHAKTMVCDNFVSIIGTTNLDQRSFDLNFEVNAVIYDENLSNHLRNAFLNDLQKAEKIDLKQWNQRSFFIIFIEQIIRLFSPIMSLLFYLNLPFSSYLT